MSDAVHKLNASLLSEAVRIIVIGCGGTGAAFAGGLPFLHQSMRALGHPGGLDVTLADGDTVSESNCVRQPFSIHDIGRNKAETLITRINHFWGLNWRAHPDRINADTDLGNFHMVVGCVDTRAARRGIDAAIHRGWRHQYWFDAGNDADFGQIVLGVRRQRNDPEQPTPQRLPTVAELLPATVARGREDTAPSCSAAEALTKQAPFVNHVIAHHMLFLLGQLFRTGRLSHHGMHINLATGTVNPIPVNPRAWEVLRGVPATPERGKKSRRKAAREPVEATT